jgi:uncharacterized MAPEG superfamily protein
MTASLYSLLAFTLWTVLILTVGVGLHRLSLIFRGRAQLADFPGDQAHGPDRYRRTVRAHANCVENLPVFAALVLTAHAAGLESAAFEALSVSVPVARLGQTLAHIASGSNFAIAVRFLFFLVQLIAFLTMAGVIAAGGSAFWRG